MFARVGMQCWLMMARCVWLCVLMVVAVCGLSQVKVLNLEEGGAFTVSSAEDMLAAL